MKLMNGSGSLHVWCIMIAYIGRGSDTKMLKVYAHRRRDFGTVSRGS